MHRALLILLASAVALCAQPQPEPVQPAPGLETEWDVAVILKEMSAHAGRLLPALDRVDARAWVEKGASETYVRQLESSRQQAKALADGAKALARNPEKLSQCLELFFRIEALENMLGSLEDGIRKYQGAADAQALATLSAENGANRERFRGYIVNLAAAHENQLEVMDQEAQRCRGIMSVQPASRASGKKR